MPKVKYLDELSSVSVPTAEASDFFEVVLTLGTQPIFYDALTLDGLLAYSVVQRATQGRGYPESAEPYWIPLPLSIMWHHENGLPLWAATRFSPIDKNSENPVYWHKREFTPTFLKRKKNGTPPNLNFTNGVHKSYRIPMPAQTASTWCAYGQGDIQSVASLLSEITHVGKKRTYGYGRVLTCEVNPIDVPALPLGFDNRLIKAIPFAFKLDNPQLWDDADGLEMQARFCGWTPPYWHGACMESCWC